MRLVNEFSLLDIIHILDALAEIALVDFLTDDSLIKALQLCECEEWWQQLETDGTSFYFITHQFESPVHHLVVVGIHGWNLVDLYPFNTVLLAKFIIVVIDIDKCIIGYRDHTLSRVTVYSAKSTNLAHIDIVQTCQFVKGTVGSLVETLVTANEASIEAPFAATRVQLSFTDQNLQLVVVETEDDTVDRQKDFLEFFIIRCHCCFESITTMRYRGWSVWR